MKSSEWKRRIGMDLEGVRSLGAALLAQAENCQARAREALAVAQKLDETDSPWPTQVGSLEAEVQSWGEKRRDLLLLLKELRTPRHLFKSVKALRPMDFRFRWDQLRDHPLLIGYLSDDQPDFARNWDRETPISQRSPDSVTDSLASIFRSECERLVAPSAKDVPELRTKDDFLFYLTVWKHCEREAGRGQPSGRRWADGLMNAASHACFLRSEAERLGAPISTEEAIRRAVEKFQVVSSTRFETHPDKESVIVSNALGNEGPMAGAVKAIRRQISLWDAEEKLLNRAR